MKNKIKKILCLSCFLFFVSLKAFSEDSIDQISISSSAQLALSTNEYMVTAGDVYTLYYVAGSTKTSYTIPVDSTYKIRVANLAIINAEGKTVSQLKAQVEDIVSKNYPMSGVQFILTTPATFKITIKGEVNNTTVKEAGALTRLSSVVSDTFTPYSSNRDIIIKSTNGTEKKCDLFKAYRFGDLNQDPYLRPDDTIIINKLSRSVTISGAVKRPGTYTLLEKENLTDLIEYYGDGLTAYADTSRIELKRYNQSELANQALYLNQKDITINYELKNLDTINIPSSTDLRPIMFIEGAITQASTTTSVGAAQNTKYSVRFDPETNYASLVRSNESLFGPNSDLENAFIVRNERTINIDLTKMLYDRSYYSEEIVQPDDRLMIPFKQGFITVSGAVRAPGRFPYIPGRDYMYYINLAGGYLPDIFPNVTIRNDKRKKLKKTDPLTPECTINATTFSYSFNQYSGPISVLLTFVTSIFSFIILFNQVIPIK